MTKKNKTKSKKAPGKTELSPSMLIISDLVSILFSLMPGVAAFSIAGLFIYHGYAYTWFVLPLTPFVLFASFIIIIAAIRLCLPRLKPGRYKREMNQMTVAWFCHFALTRSAKVIGLIPLLQTFNIAKFFYWRALGAKVSFQIVSSFDIDFVDCPLITVGKNVTLASGVSISCHSDVGSLLFLAPVIIEDNVFIGMDTVIGPGTTIKKGCWIGYGNTFVNQVVEENTRLGNVRPTPDME
ncbi:2,3,4,5-tetrahydropyridine-2,6-carboxylate N-succinyltransferase [Legionella steigerwaltii]|uniref:2,3,4,5-tetrahydropyridine-2,6-carboxylate N-succinyltransferase n=1 Tax=Legionella steigerwaltii TaxID=460 RepID=A0A378L8C4_9GAMM|nr:DapH/DapD/GlmU-related protein [Legionella steigerwaltii]KTD78100.1 2,3,4,5-tetrahydropyridine-2,6-carboxylate N-succinyltransferase [Legionella steigerwaltii]STY22162.1 2,3,4,5-tetrahydropyridine-2,6-carboxylate N-succinyltransferase [Legionella steigerwaltii]